MATRTPPDCYTHKDFFHDSSSVKNVFHPPVQPLSRRGATINDLLASKSKHLRDYSVFEWGVTPEESELFFRRRQRLSFSNLVWRKAEFAPQDIKFTGCDRESL